MRLPALLREHPVRLHPDTRTRQQASPETSKNRSGLLIGGKRVLRAHRLVQIADEAVRVQRVRAEVERLTELVALQRRNRRRRDRVRLVLQELQPHIEQRLLPEPARRQIRDFPGGGGLALEGGELSVQVEKLTEPRTEVDTSRVAYPDLPEVGAARIDAQLLIQLFTLRALSGKESSHE